MNNSQLFFIHSCILKGISSFADSLNWAWPFSHTSTGGRYSTIPERNIIAHLSYSFLSNDFKLYVEVPVHKDKCNERIDLFAISYDKEILLAIEVNGTPGWPEKIANDYYRLLKFSMPLANSSHFNLDYSNFKKAAVLITTSNDEDFADMWMKKSNPEILSENMLNLYKILELSDNHSMIISEIKAENEDRNRFWRCLYSIIPI